MNVLSTKIYEDALLLLIFLPTNLVNNKSQAYIHQLLKMWSWIPNSSIWDYNIVSLVQRFVKVNFPNAPWNNGTALTNNWDSLSIIYTQFVRMTGALSFPTWRRFSAYSYTRMIGLAIGGTSLLKLPKQKAPYYIKALYPRHESTLFARLASLIIYTLPHGSQQLTQLISQLSSFFHPSNGGKWTIKLASFLTGLTHSYLRRVAKGQFDAAIEHSKFVELLLPIVIPALYSKTVFMASAAVQASASLICSSVHIFLVLACLSLTPLLWFLVLRFAT
jgi:proteasome activator subunit 4